MRTERRRRPLALRALLSGLPLVLAFTVNAPARAADKEPVLTIKGDLRDEVRDNVRVLVGLDDAACQPGPGQKALILRQVRNRSEEAMQALGYYQPDIVPQWRDATGDACFGVTLTITPGPRTKVETLSITFNGEAQQDPAFQNAIDKASLSPGDPLRHDRYEALKRRLQQLLIDRGYAEGSLSTHRLEVDRARHRARVVMVVDSGPRYSDRTLDIDIVLFDDLVAEGPGPATPAGTTPILRVPRDELRHAFVLRPLAEIAPDQVEPRSKRTLAQLWADSPEREVAMEAVAGFDPAGK